MLRNFAIGLGVVAALAVAANLQAQGPGGPGGRGGMMGGQRGSLLMLLQNEQVQKEIELVADQKEKITALNKETQDARAAARADMANLSQEERQAKMKEAAEKTEKKVEGILNPKQLKRMEQIQLQVQGGVALSNPKVVKALALTDDQQAKIKTINDDSRKAMADMRSGGGPPSDEDRAKMQKSMKETETKLMDVLTADQKGKLEKMKGEKFDTSVLRGGPRE